MMSTDATPLNAPAATLSDDDAITRLYDLAAQGDHDSAELARLDALVYGRLLQAYETGAVTPGVTRVGGRRV